MVSSLPFPEFVTDNLQPRLKPGFRAKIIPEEGVALLSEQRTFLLHGFVYTLLIPLLNGHCTVEEIIHRTEEQVSAPEIFSALVSLKDEGFTIDVPSSLPPEQMSFWDGLNIDSEVAAQQLATTTITITTLGGIAPAPFQQVLGSLGVQVGPCGDVCVALTDDYLRSELDTLNRDMFASETPWLIAKPVGAELWLGPLFIPGKTSCWECLASRLRGRSEYLRQEKMDSPDSPTILQAGLPTTLQVALNMTATEIAKWIVRGKNEVLEDCIVTLDTLSCDKNNHRLIRRPQCSVCGDPQLVAAHQSLAFMLQGQAKSLNPDGGYRKLSAEKTWQLIEHHVSPVSGIVSHLQTASQWVETPGFTPPYIARHNFLHAVRDYGSDWDVLLGGLQDGSAGKGGSALQSKVSAVCEAIERYSGVFQGDEARVWGTYRELGASAIHPNACMLYSEQQYQNRAEWNKRGSRLPTTWVPEPFDEDGEIEWSPVWSLTTGEKRYLPMAYCYYGYSRVHGTWFARGDSNGCAAGASREEAIVQGFIELVERDSVALWWYNCLKRPAVDLSTFDDPYFSRFLDYYNGLQREVWTLDITSDLGVPALAAVSRQREKGMEGLLFGFGAHFDPQVALRRALTEVDQQLAAFSAVTADRDQGIVGADPEMLCWWQDATVAQHPYLLPDDTVTSRRRTDYTDRSSDDFRTDILTCVEIVREHGLETLVLDQTRPDIGLPVVKVIVPGLRHFWARFGPGRLYDVPVKMGWLKNPKLEAELNPQYIYV